MKVPQMIAAELRRLTSTRMSIIALLALVCVPVIYGGLYLWANRDPYGNLDQVPAAIVVADQGDENRIVGHDVAENLIDDGTFDWHLVSASSAATGLEDGRYDFSITFPSDFTEALDSASGDDPRQATVAFATNDANNYLATTIGKQAVATIQAQIAKEVGHEAAITFLNGLDEIRGKLGDAADGASRLRDAAGQATDGARALQSGASALADGTSTLASGSAQLADGAGSAADGAAAAADAAHKLADGSAQVAAGNRQLADKADAVGTTVADAAALIPQARADLQQRLADQGLDDAAIAQALTAFDTATGRLSQGAAQLQTVVGQVDDLAAGSRQVADGAGQLATGTQTLADGARQVADGSRSLADGAATASDGAARLRDGSGTLADGLGQLQSGAGTLSDALANGQASIPATTADSREKQADAIADPVRVKTDAVTAAGNYGAGLAPFFAALAGWIGIYALFLIVKPVSRRAMTAVHSPVRVTLAGWLTPTLLGAIQMSALYVILSWSLGFTVVNPAGMLGIMLLASATYTAIVLALNVWLGSVGQFLGLVLMVLQLVTAGGTFPWQTLPAPLAALHHVLPMGYVVDALRQAMYGGNLGSALADVGVLLIWLAGAFAVAAIGVTRMTHFRTLRDLQPSLIG
ncbi:YhgE/Pip domain-containing protein [Rathayibacter sp. YIM 133350]|uniref:YhgE/Pip domain-containing protein n=1 Tax=Rathayibacter sp. YIM 133350 TaxID=3131992 RepID=UPI00307DF697